MAIDPGAKTLYDEARHARFQEVFSERVRELFVSSSTSRYLPALPPEADVSRLPMHTLGKSIKPKEMDKSVQVSDSTGPNYLARTQPR